MMCRKLLLAVSIVFLCAFRADKSSFNGVLVYQQVFFNLEGVDITDKLAPILGAESRTYIRDSYYKVCNEQGQVMQLYTGHNNQFVAFQNEQPIATLNADKSLSKSVKVTHLPDTATIAGYACKAIQIVDDSVTTIYFYAPELKVNPASFTKHALGAWDIYMHETGGALTLKYLLKNPKLGYIMLSEATSIKRLHLTEADFQPPAVVR